MKTETTATISAKIQKQPARPKQLPQFLVCDNPLCGDEIYVRRTDKNSFTIRMHDLEVVEGSAWPEEIAEAQNFYLTYLSFIDNDK